MNEQNKIDAWIHDFRNLINSVSPTDSEPTPNNMKDNFLACENDIIFFFLIYKDSINIQKQDYVTQDYLASYSNDLISKSSLIRNIATCKKEISDWNVHFYNYVMAYSMLAKPGPVRVHKNYVFFFHTLFSSWNTEFYKHPSIWDPSPKGILDLWDNFHKLTTARCTEMASSNCMFYNTLDYNLKLFKWLFDIDIESQKEIYRQIFDSFPKNSFCANSFLASECEKIIDVLSAIQRYIDYPSLQHIILDNFINQLNPLLYNAEDFRNNPNLLISTNPITVKYTDKDKTMEKFARQLFRYRQDLKRTCLKIIYEYSECFEYSSIKITYLNANISIGQYENMLTHEYQRVLALIIEDIKVINTNLSESKIHNTIRNNIIKELNIFLNNLNTCWKKRLNQHIRRLEYNADILQKQKETSTIRRERSSIERNSDSVYPIVEFFSDATRHAHKTYKKIFLLEGKELKVSSIDTKQKQLDYLYYQTLYIIDQYKTVSLNKINNRIPNLQCDAQTLFSYLHKQQYFCDVQDKQY